MARTILSNESRRIIDPAILTGLAEDITLERHPGIADQPDAFDARTSAMEELISPVLEGLVQAYRQACATPYGREAAKRFLTNLLEAEMEG
jgi:hypothetical protein